MAAGNMSNFVTQHANYLSRVLGASQEACMDEHLLAACNERIEPAVLNQVNSDKRGI